DDLTYMGCDIEADDIRKLDRAHGHAEIHRRLVDDGEWYALLRGKHGFVEIWHQHAVDHEPRRTAAGDRQLIQLPREPDRSLHDRGAGARRLNYLDQRHLRNRIEEMQTNQPLGPCQLFRERLEQQARRVGREDRVRFHARFQTRVQLLLDLQALVDRLD